MKRLRWTAVVLLTAAAFFAAPPKTRAESCPIYRQCMVLYPEGWCFCEGFYCNGEFICGMPIE